jgi:hypothetical protein
MGGTLVLVLALVGLFRRERVGEEMAELLTRLL